MWYKYLSRQKNEKSQIAYQSKLQEKTHEESFKFILIFSQ